MRIKEASQKTGLPEKTIRYYEDIGLVTPLRNADNGYREFKAQHIQDLHFLHQAREMDFSLDECEQLLELKRNPNRMSHDVKSIVNAHIELIEKRISNLANLKATLAELASQCSGDESPECAILKGIQNAQCNHLSDERPTSNIKNKSF
ncbi:MAG: MerR family transcriptional regulator [Pseudomonadales bacterium]|nr:MerR family transcriptional regulator [Pseudomonadales bacterium]